MMTSRWKLIISLAGIFILGGVTGSLLVLRFGDYLTAKNPQPQISAAPTQWGVFKLKNLVSKLDLAPDQTEDIRLVIDDAVVELRRLQGHNRIEAAKILDKLEADIEPLLSSEQVAKLKKLEADDRNKMLHQLEDQKNQVQAADGAK